jgi:ferrochelatase
LAPLVEDVVKELAAQGCKKFLSLPGYPQYSLTTTKGALARVRAAVKRYAPDASVSEIVSWPLESHFLEAHADLILKEAVKFFDPNPRNIHLLFSAHSIPENLVTKLGDPYKYQMEETVQGVLKKLSWAGPWTLAWQSKLGPMKWLGPSTHAVIDRLGKQGVKQVLVVPIAFVTDHIETLNEIDLMFRADAKRAGIREFRRTPGLNAHPLFIEALVSLAKGPADFWF